MAPSPSGFAALQYLCDMRHGALGARLTAAFQAPPLRPRELQHEVALVTGGTGGIGLATAQALCAAGAEVHVTGRNEERGQAAARSTPPDSTGSIKFHKLDMSTPAAARQLDTIMQKELGSRPLDILVQNLACMPDRYELVGSGGGGGAVHERSLSTNVLAFYECGTRLHARMAGL